MRAFSQGTFSAWCLQYSCSQMATKWSDRCLCVCLCILHNIQITPHKLNAGRTILTGAKSASAWPEDRKRHLGLTRGIEGDKPFRRILVLVFLCYHLIPFFVYQEPVLARMRTFSQETSPDWYPPSSRPPMATQWCVPGARCLFSLAMRKCFATSQRRTTYGCASRARCR